LLSPLPDFGTASISAWLVLLESDRIASIKSIVAGVIIAANTNKPKTNNNVAQDMLKGAFFDAAVGDS
jgi:hypothetical protein